MFREVLRLAGSALIGSVVWLDSSRRLQGIRLS
jgi:hypothetical protein